VWNRGTTRSGLAFHRRTRGVSAAGTTTVELRTVIFIFSFSLQIWDSEGKLKRKGRLYEEEAAVTRVVRTAQRCYD